MKFVPWTLSVKASAPAGALLGESAVIVGVGFGVGVGLGVGVGVGVGVGAGVGVGVGVGVVVEEPPPQPMMPAVTVKASSNVTMLAADRFFFVAAATTAVLAFDSIELVIAISSSNSPLFIVKTQAGSDHQHLGRSAHGVGCEFGVVNLALLWSA